MLVYEIAIEDRKGKMDVVRVRIDEYNNFSQEVVDLFNSVLEQRPDVAKIHYIDYIGDDEEEEI